MFDHKVLYANIFHLSYFLLDYKFETIYGCLLLFHAQTTEWI